MQCQRRTIHPSAAAYQWRWWPTSRSTLQRVEAGDPAVSIGIYAAVMHQALALP